MALSTVKTNRKESILIVDDEYDVRMTLELMLASEGYACHLAATSGEAMEQLQKQPVDLVVTDMNLMGSSCSGLELIDLVRDIDDTIPVVVITGYPSVNVAVSAMKHGAIEFLSKPFERDHLLHVALKALQERRLRMENQRLQAEVNKAAVIEKLNRELNSRINELTRLYTISEGLNKFMDTQSLLDKVVDLAAQVTGAQRVSLMLVDNTRRFLKIRSAIGLPKGIIEQTLAPVGKGIAGYVASTGQSIRMTQSELRPAASPQQSNRSNYKTNSWLSMPLLIDQEIFGVLNLTDKLDRVDFAREDEQIMDAMIEKAVIKLENQALYEGIYQNLVDTLTSLVSTIEAKDPYTREHSARVTEYAMNLARFMGISEDEIEMLNFAGMLHDIGKIGVRDDILTKAGRLTAAEYETVKLHPIIGERIVEPLGLINAEKNIIRHHHERYDGKGYPSGLAGESIPLLARVVAVTDAFDAMTTTRSYRQALPIEQAVSEMQRHAGAQFDPLIVESLITALSENLINPTAIRSRRPAFLGS